MVVLWHSLIENEKKVRNFRLNRLKYFVHLLFTCFN